MQKDKQKVWTIVGIVVILATIVIYFIAMDRVMLSDDHSGDDIFGSDKSFTTILLLSSSFFVILEELAILFGVRYILGASYEKSLFKTILHIAFFVAATGLLLYRLCCMGFLF